MKPTKLFKKVASANDFLNLFGQSFLVRTCGTSSPVEYLKSYDDLKSYLKMYFPRDYASNLLKSELVPGSYHGLYFSSYDRCLGFEVILSYDNI